MNTNHNSDNASVRPKIRSQNTEKLIGESLEKRSVRFEDRDGIQRYYPALHIRFSHSMVFIKYKIPPIETIADLHLNGDKLENNHEIQKWISNVQKYEEMLKILLRLQHNQFWSTLIYERSLQVSLESYLRLAPRDHDLHNFMITDQMKIAVKRVHTLMFKLYLRMSSSTESKTNFISPNTYGNLIYENYLFDIPKIIDLSVLYGNTNYQQLLIRMFSNVIQCQPRYLKDISKACTNASEALSLIQEKFGIDDNQFGNSTKLKYFQWPELQSAISNLTDISVSLRMLLVSVPQSANIYRAASIEKTIVEFYNRIFPLLQEELDHRFASIENSDLIANGIKHQILTARSNFIQTFRDIVKICFFDQLFNQSSTNDAKLRLIDELLDVLTLASYERSFVTDYFHQYPVEQDFAWLSQHSNITQFKSVDQARIDYLISLINSNILTNKPRSSPIPTDESEPKINGFVEAEATNGVDIELESQIQYIREIIPDLGSGFVEMCLQFYNLDNEKALNAILEDNLPPQLSQLDRNLQRVPKKSIEIPSKESQNSSESPINESIESQVPKIIDERHNVYNNDEFDIFRNKNVDLSKIHRGKRERTTSQIDDQTKEKIMSIHYKALEDEENDLYSYYDDEYDDTYEDDTRIDLPSDKLMDELVSQQASNSYKNNDYKNNDNKNNDNKNNDYKNKDNKNKDNKNKDNKNKDNKNNDNNNFDYVGGKLPVYTRNSPNYKRVTPI